MIRPRHLPSLLLPLLVGALLLAACDFTEVTGGGNGEQGSGDLLTEQRDVSPFTRIEVGTAVTLDIVVDPAADVSVTVTYDDNLLDNLITRVAGDKLIVGLEDNVRLTGNADRKVEITMQELESVEASGATRVTAVGTAERLTLEVSGASTVDLADFEVRDVELNASGASNVVLNVAGVVSGSASGASNVKVRGNPTSVLIDSSGASSIDVP